MEKDKLRYYLPVIVSAVFLIILFLLPTGYEGAVIYQGMDRCAARVLEVDDSMIIDTGLVRSGEQSCTLELLSGKYQGEIVNGCNMLNGSLEQDKIFAVGDKAQVVVSYQGDEIGTVTMIDHYRINVELLLAGFFAVFLLFFAGQTGLRAILSFGVTVLCIWKILVPLYLKGVNPVGVGMIVTLLLTGIIISLVYGFDRRTASAVLGAAAGLLVTAVLGIFFTKAFKIHGAVMSYSESLLYSGYQDLNLTGIFMASIFIGSSGAVMDLAVDITSAVREVVDKKPDISRWEAVKSGINVGRAAMGTMTTTLLLAYSGGYIALLMVFMAQGTPLYNIFNYKYVSAEILHTLVGSFGLVTTAPLTALTAGMLLTGEKRPLPAGETQETSKEHTAGLSCNYALRYHK
ncbi:MAG: YibE/F family protein [Bacteroidales bacterium]|nr:YibE/F family protein [Anaerotignum sp.]MCI5678940.1 YibE/F family protein [Bacteroidales bacterium]MDY3927340.1 YibE/F family protein [Anaerotignum sp.]